MLYFSHEISLEAFWPASQPGYHPDARTPEALVAPELFPVPLDDAAGADAVAVAEDDMSAHCRLWCLVIRPAASVKKGSNSHSSERLDCIDASVNTGCERKSER